MPILPFPEWRPDVSSYMVAASQTIQNVVPRADGYGPFGALTSFSAALPAQCRGFFFAIKNDGSVSVFAGTSTRLYQLNNTTLAWTDVSKGGVAYTAVPTADHWQFAQFGNLVLAVQANTVPQVFDLTSSSAFADLSGSPPQARYIAIVGRFVVLSGLLSTPYRIQWSGQNAVTTWTPGTNSSDFQDLPDGGVVRGVAGGEFGAIFQDKSIRRMIYAPGSAVVFAIERVTQDKGLYAPFSLIRAGNRIFFLAAQGFHEMGATGSPVEIGKEKFDRTFFAAHDASALQYVIGSADPRETRVYWTYRQAGSSTAGFDRVICYDYALGRATPLTISGEYIATLSRPGFTLESLDSISPSIDALTFSLDEVSVATTAALAGVAVDHKLGFFTGANLEATLDSSEQAVEGRRARVKGFRPITDAASCYGAIGARETLQAAVAYSTEQVVNGRGFCPANVSTRLARARLRIPSGTSWTFATGVEPEFAQEGRR